LHVPEFDWTHAARQGPGWRDRHARWPVPVAGARRSRRWSISPPRSEDWGDEHVTLASPPNVGGGRAQGAGRSAPSTGRGPACYHRTEDRADEVVDLRSRSWRPGKGWVVQMRCSGPGPAANPVGLALSYQGTEPDSAEPADLRNTRTMPPRYAASTESAGRVIEDQITTLRPYNARYTGDPRSIFRKRYMEMITRVSLDLSYAL
jgi:hypothetical protein